MTSSQNNAENVAWLGLAASLIKRGWTIDGDGKIVALASAASKIRREVEEGLVAKNRSIAF